MDFMGKPIDNIVGWKCYEAGREFNNRINLDDTVRVNENFFVGKQWEGVEANGLPTPQMNFLKRVVSFVVASITTDNLAIQATVLPSAPQKDKLRIPLMILNDEFQSLLETNRVARLLRVFARDAAVRGSGCMYAYWDDRMNNGQSRGGIKTEILKNNRVYFGNKNSHEVQSQPYIIIEQMVMEREAQLEAKRNGNKDWESICADSDDHGADSAKKTNDKVTVLTMFWRDEESGKINAFKFCQKTWIREPWDMKIRRYPIVWMPWDYVDDCYHGQAMLTGIIPNQIFVNKSWAMTMLSIMKMAFPKWVYDNTRIKAIDNRVGSAIAVAGGDVNNAIRAIDPPAISPQVYQFIESAVEQTQENLGASNVALGDTRPDNTSAIVALQRAAATPSELTKLALHEAVEDLFRIYAEFIIEGYGTRLVDMETPDDVREAVQFSGMKADDEITVKFNFSKLRDLPILLKMEAGASSYYSEIASINTLDNLLMQGKIDVLDYLKRIPDGYIPDRRGLIADVEKKLSAAPQDAPTAPFIDMNQEQEIEGGSGYGALQRKINEGVS